MDDPIDIALILSHPRYIPARLHDPYAVQPWEKNTLEAEQVPRTYKTFYQGTSQPIPRTTYSTQRAFSSAKHQEYSKYSQKIVRQQSSGKKTVGNVSQQSAVTQYNITGNFLTEPAQKRSFNNQFYMRNKEKKNKNKLERGRIADIPISSLSQIRKRFSFQKQSSVHEDQGLIRLGSERQQQYKRQKLQSMTAGRQKRKSKLISVGFRKISVIRSLLKQKSLNLQPLPF